MPLITAPLRDVATATPRTRLLSIALDVRAFAFQPGQAVMIGAHGQPQRRPYSIACSPERAAETSGLELLIALDDGAFGAHLADAAPGRLVDVEGPLGTFVMPAGALPPRLLFVAGGTGIAPLRAMIDHVLRQANPPAISLLYSARGADEFVFADELAAHERARRLELHCTVTRQEGSGWAGGRGRIGRAHFEAVLHEPAATLCFICGPRAMVTESVTTLQALGVPDAAIRTEGWAVPRV